MEFFTEYVMMIIGYVIPVTRDIRAEDKSIIFKVNEQILDK